MSYKIAILAMVALQALTPSAHRPCVCTRNLRPVCGSDGKTYSNECILNCERYNTGSDITVARDGPCTPAEPICICTYEYKPVCGNDGSTYPNRCALLCERSKNPQIDVVSEGECSNEVKVAEPPCICTEELNEVCGSDGNTYANPCLLNCATAKDSTLRVQSQGKCDDRVRVADPFPQPPPCTCTREDKPVCGSDGTTYANPCLLNCATANNPSLSVKHQGHCPPPCICTEELREVCGSDGKTYSNPCELNCATANDPSLRVQSEGRCDRVNVANPSQPQSCTCPRDLKPVCGSDGVTYNNECLLRCAGVNISIARRAPCQSY